MSRLYETQPPYFNEYLRRYREDPTSRVFAPLAEAYRRMGRVDDAIAICLEGLTHHPLFHGGRVALAKAYLDKRQFREACAELCRVILAVPENLLAQRLLGDTWMELNDRVQALHCYKMALLLSPNDVQLAERVHRLERGDSVLQPFDQKAGTFGGLDDADDPKPLWGVPAEPVSTNSGRSTQVELQSLHETGRGAGFDFDTHEEDEEEIRTDAVDALLLDQTDSVRTMPEDGSYQIEHVSAVLGATPKPKREITTATLGELYYAQGQYDKALKIFEKLPVTPDVVRKMNACRANLGVDDATRLRHRQIVVLRSVLMKVRASS